MTPKPDYCEVAGRRRDNELWLYEQERDSKAYIVDEKAHDFKVRKGSRNPICVNHESERGKMYDLSREVS